MVTSGLAEMTNHRNRALLSLSALMVVTSCGDGPGFSGLGDGVAPPAGGPPPPPPQQGTFITLTSDTDDYIGAGENYAYTLADALITITAQDGLLTVDGLLPSFFESQYQGVRYT